MKALYEELKQEFYQLLGLISVEELASNREIAEVAKTLQRKLVAACS